MFRCNPLYAALIAERMCQNLKYYGTRVPSFIYPPARHIWVKGHENIFDCVDHLLICGRLTAIGAMQLCTYLYLSQPPCRVPAVPTQWNATVWGPAALTSIRLASAEMSLSLILAASQWKKEKEEGRDGGREGEDWSLSFSPQKCYLSITYGARGRWVLSVC